MNNRPQWVYFIFIILFFYLFILQIQAIWPFTIDDSYISLRYAKHWASGDGLLWNIQEPPVEGYSNFSFVVVGALSILAHLDPIVILKSLGILGLFFSCYFIYLISRFWFESELAWLPCIAALLYKGEIIWAVSGLETTVYQALIVGSVYFAFKGLGYNLYPNSRTASRYSGFILSAFFLSLAGITRFEAPALMLLFLLLMCWDKPERSDLKHWKGITLFLLTLILLYCPYFLWRIYYYGLLFPNSVYCKAFSGEYAAAAIQYLKLAWPYFILSFYALLKTQDKRYYFLFLPSIVYLVLLLEAEPLVAFNNRLFLTPFVLLLPLALQGVSTLILFLLKARDNLFIISVYLIAFCIGFLFIPMLSLHQYHYFAQAPVQGELLRKNVVNWLNLNTKGGEHVVLGDSGLIPYLSDLNFTDSYCLNNRNMINYPELKRYKQFCQHTLKEKPEVIILTSLIEDGKEKYIPSDFCLKRMLKVNKEYKLNTLFTIGTANSLYRYELFTKV